MDQLLRRADTAELGNPGQFGTHTPSRPDITALAAPLSAQDALSAEVLRRCPDAVGWTAHPHSTEDGHIFDDSIDVHFAGGGTLRFEPNPLDEPEVIEMIANLTFEKQPGHIRHEVTLAAFRGGARERVASFGARPAPDVHWRDQLRAAVQHDHPDLLALSIATRNTGSGFVWARSGTGRAARGKLRPISLATYGVLLAEASGEKLSSWSLITLDLRP